MDERIDITIGTLTGQNHPISISSSATLQELNDAIYQATNILQDEQKLFFDKKPVTESNKKLSDYGMTSGSKLYLVRGLVIRPEKPSPEGTFTIHLKELTGKIHNVTVTKDTTIDQLKEHAAGVGWDPSKIRMIYKGVSIASEGQKTLGAYGTQPGDEISLIEPLRGD